MFKRLFLSTLPIIVVALSWFIHYDYLRKHQWQLPQSLIEKPVQIVGVIEDIPVQKFHSLSFPIRVTKINNQSISTTLKLGWYQHPPVVRVGQQWRLWVRLKPPIGLHNPGGFNYEQWLIYHGISATGIVMTHDHQQLLGMVSGYGLFHLREAIQKAIMSSVSDPSIAAILSALSVGLRDHFTPADWQVFQNTGTNHLVAIAGLHIGFVVGVIYALVYFLWRLLPRLLLWVPAVRAAQIASTVSACAYAALSGFALPAQRASIMIVCLMSGALCYRKIPFYHRLFTAFSIIIIFQPFAVFSASFFLSFYAVGTLGYLLCARLETETGWRHWGRIQFYLFVALIPVSLWFFQQTSWVAMVTNAFAIPWIGFAIIPGVLIGVLFFLCGLPGIAHDIFQFTALLLKPLWALLKLFSAFPWSIWHDTFSAYWIFALALLGMMMLLAPKGLPGRWLGGLGFLALLIHQPKQPHPGDFWITVVDVGQGLSILVQTEKHALLYDTGSHIPGGFDMGAQVVLPLLRYLGVHEINLLMISHGDNDHSGGAAAVIAGLPVRAVYTSAPWLINKFDGAYCHVGQSWTWDGVEFDVLSPFHNVPYLDNNSSCVLKITNAAGSLLLTGDIERLQEKQLVDQEKERLHATVIIAPHHGSRTSSSLSFLEAVSPKYCLISLGAYNRYHFPAHSVIGRYSELGAKVYTTAGNGAINVRFFGKGQVILAHISSHSSQSSHRNYDSHGSYNS